MARTSHQINVVGKDYHMHIEDHESQVKEPTQMIKDVQPNHMQIIQNMEANQISLQNKITSMEESHVQEINVMENRLKIMEVNHSNQMSIIQNYMIAMEARHTQEMTAMKDNHLLEMKIMEANQTNLQDRFVKTELNQAKLIVRHAREMSSIQKRLEKWKNYIYKSFSGNSIMKIHQQIIRLLVC